MNDQLHKISPSQRRSGASVGVITRIQNGQTEWLLQWNPKWQAMNLIGGRKETTDANDLTCMIREIHEELFEELPPEALTAMQTTLRGDNDTYIRAASEWQDAYIDALARIGRGPFECEGFSEAAKCLTFYTFHIYTVTLQSHAPLVRHEEIPTEWGTIADIRRGVTVHGRPIGKTVAQILAWVQAQNNKDCS